MVSTEAKTEESDNQLQGGFYFRDIIGFIVAIHLGSMSMGIVAVQESLHGTTVAWIVPASKIFLYGSYYITYLLMPVVVTYVVYKLLKRWFHE